MKSFLLIFNNRCHRQMKMPSYGNHSGTRKFAGPGSRDTNQLVTNSPRGAETSKNSGTWSEDATMLVSGKESQVFPSSASHCY